MGKSIGKDVYVFNDVSGIWDIVDFNYINPIIYNPPTYKKYLFADIFGEIYTVPEIDRVIFQNPATIIFWKDGSKTVSKCDGHDGFYEHLGMANAIMKKAFGSRSAWNSHVKFLLKEVRKLPFTDSVKFDEFDLALHYVDKLYTEKKFSNMVERYMRRNYGE